MPIHAVNDFVIRFANVNGSGSASANLLFARSIMRMGVPIAPRNIFPSNIQGLPTWYEVRVSEEGRLGARGGADIIVAMNPQTFAQDIAAIEPGGYLFYNSSRPIPASALLRDDLDGDRHAADRNLHAPNMPSRDSASSTRTSSMSARWRAARHRSCGRREARRRAVQGQAAADRSRTCGRCASAATRRTPASIVRSAFACAAASAVGDRILVEGNFAAGLGAVYGGATVCAWYPITPSTSLAEAFERNCARLRIDPATGEKNYAIVQAEDEIAAIGMAVGAGWNGARAFTTTSGPGISLMQEFFGLAYFAEIPAVVFDVQRGGPSTGMPTRTQQSDLLLCAFASHGDTKHVLLLPGRSGRSLRVRGERLRSRRAAADADFRHARSRHRHEFAPHPAVPLGRCARLRPRQGHVARRSRSGPRASAATSTSTATAFPSARFPARIRRAAPISPAAPAATASPATPRKAAPMSTTWSGCCASSRPRADAASRAPHPAQGRAADPRRRDLLRLDRRGDGRGRRSPGRRQGLDVDALRLRAFPFEPGGRRLHRARTNRFSSSSRTATRRCARC